MAPAHRYDKISYISCPQNSQRKLKIRWSLRWTRRDVRKPTTRLKLNEADLEVFPLNHAEYNGIRE